MRGQQFWKEVRFVCEKLDIDFAMVCRSFKSNRKLSGRRATYMRYSTSAELLYDAFRWDGASMLPFSTKAENNAFWDEIHAELKSIASGNMLAGEVTDDFLDKYGFSKIGEYTYRYRIADLTYLTYNIRTKKCTLAKKKEHYLPDRCSIELPNKYKSAESLLKLVEELEEV